MPRFERNRMTILLGEKCSVSSSDIPQTQPQAGFCSEPRAPKLHPQKCLLFSDYRYITLQGRRGKTIERRNFPCFKDSALFREAPPSMPMEFDNDLESDDGQIRDCKRRMLQSLLESVNRREEESEMDEEEERGSY